MQRAPRIDRTGVALMGVRRPTWRIFVAVLAGAALLAQAALSSSTPPAGLGALAIDAIAAHALCLGAGPAMSDRGVPPPPSDRLRQGCCILCTAPALDALAVPPDLAALTWGPPLAAPLRRLAARDPVSPSELSPVRARAPPLA